MMMATTLLERLFGFGSTVLLLQVVVLALLGGTTGAVSLGARAAVAGFTNGFEGVKAGSTLELTWEGVEERFYPLCVTAQVIEKGRDGVSATVYKANVTHPVNGTSFSWKGVPFPLNHFAEGMYQLEIHPAGTTGSHLQLLAKSPFFQIGKAEVGSGASDGKNGKPSTSGSNQGNGSASNVNKPLAIGLGVAIGLPSLVALVVVGWCFRTRRRKALAEKRRRTRRDFVIN